MNIHTHERKANDQKRIRCSDCVYARPDPNASEKNWTAFECGNEASEFHKALLNVGYNGDRQKSITWSGCREGKRRCGR